MIDRLFQPLPDLPLDEAMQRGREDVAFFSHYWLARKLHDGQADYCANANASINVLPTSNRWGKTTLLAVRHYHKCFYKLGGEPRYIIDGRLDQSRYLKTPYKTVHTAGLWDTAKLVWDDCLRVAEESKRLSPWIKDAPRTLPPHITLLNGAQILFRTLGDHGEGIDGKSFYHISIDEAGWIKNLGAIMDNVARIRVADVRGTIDIVGTMKPGLSADFYKYGRRAAVYTGTKVSIDHRDGRDYLKDALLEAGIGE